MGRVQTAVLLGAILLLVPGAAYPQDAGLREAVLSVTGMT